MFGNGRAVQGNRAALWGRQDSDGHRRGVDGEAIRLGHVYERHGSKSVEGVVVFGRPYLHRGLALHRRVKRTCAGVRRLITTYHMVTLWQEVGAG